MATEPDDQDASYIDYEAFLDPTFSPSSFANTLVLTTNNANDIPLDLSTPLSRVLFDIQEIDSHIDALTSRAALPLLEHTRTQTAASTRIVSEVDAQIKTLNDSYKQLEKEVIQKHAEAEEVRAVAGRLWETLRLGRAVGRALQLGRQLEVQHGELASSTSTSGSNRREDHRALVRCAQTLLQLRELRELLDPQQPNEGEKLDLDRVAAISALRASTILPVERAVRETSERIVREFSISSTSTFTQVEDTRARTVSALTALYLLSPERKGEKWTPEWMLAALETYLRTQLQSSIAGLSRALAALPGLDRALGEVSARCQNVVGLEAVLAGAKLPEHHIVTEREKEREREKHTGEKEKGNLLQPLLAHLETGSLASYFWRSMASSLATRVQEIVARGGISARALKGNRQSVGESIRECVVRGSVLPGSMAAGKGGKKGEGERGDERRWERESAVMVGAVVGNLGR